MRPNAISYDEGPRRYNDYHGLALTIYDFSRERGELWSLDPDLLYELTYLMALSRIGEIHDRRGIHRIHALGIAVGDRGGLVLLPESGGKSTLALKLLEHSETKILSDDTPLIAKGKLRAFPTRIGIRGKAEEIDPEYLRTFKRRNHGTKTLIDVSYFRDRVTDDVSPEVVIAGVRSGGSASRIEAVSRISLVPVTLANLVFGLGLPQVVEYFLRGGAADAVRKSTIVASRVLTGVRLLRGARCYRLVLGSNLESAASEVLSVLKVD